MKKPFIVFLVVLAIVAVAFYSFIPNKLEISKTIYINVVPDVVYRNLSEEARRQRWWPTETALENTSPNAIRYVFTHKSINAIEILILFNNSKFQSTLRILPVNKGSTALQWKFDIETSYSPFEKIKFYQKATWIKKEMNQILGSLQSFLAKEENQYNPPMELSTVTDTLLVSTKVSLNHYPVTAEVYSLISSLKQYISVQGAKETNYPMLHVIKVDSIRFETMVAIPVNKEVSNSENLVFKRMVPGNIVITKVQGGHHNIAKAFNEMELYLNDNQLASPAIPFESLVTDRLKEPDTSKWVTRIYYPVY